jgi:hypothetical protein
MPRLALLLAFFLAACGALTGDDDGGDCFFDCFGSSSCADGVVRSVHAIYSTCEEAAAAGVTECESEVTYHCARGCRTDETEIDTDQAPEQLCEENRPKQVGDPCTDDSGCRPEVATINADGSVTNVYLQCDMAAGQCVSRDAPVVPDLYASCGLVPESNAFEGVVSSDACSTTVCAFQKSGDCFRDICTASCSSDGDCPAGTTCLDWGVGVCVPPDWAAAGIACN